MYLYETKYGKIGVYSLIPKQNLIRHYKMCEMQKVPKRLRVFEATEYVTPPSSPLLVTAPNRNENYVTKAQKENIFMTPCEGYIIDQVLQDYYNGRFVNPKKPYSTIKMEINGGYGYFLMGWPYQKQNVAGPYSHYVNKMVLLPESLYLLDAIEQRKFSLIKDNDIREQLSLFTVNKEYEIRISDVLTQCSEELKESFYKQLAIDYSEDKFVLRQILH